MDRPTSLGATKSSTQAARLTRGYLIALVATVIWSSTGVFIRYLTQTYALPPLVLAFWRDLFVASGIALALLVVAPRQLRVPARQLPFLLLFGFFLAIFNSLWTVAVSLTGAAVATVLCYNSAAFTAVIGWRLFGERLGVVKVTAVLMALIGCVLVARAYDLAAWRLNPLGLATGLIAGLTFALYNIMGRAASRRAIAPWTTMLYIFGSAAGFLLLFQLVPGLFNPGMRPQLLHLGSAAGGWGVLVALAVGPTTLGYGLYMVSLGYLPASVANLIATLEPAFTALLAFIFLHEVLSVVQLAGGALILLGVVLLRLRNEGAG